MMQIAGYDLVIVEYVQCGGIPQALDTSSIQFLSGVDVSSPVWGDLASTGIIIVHRTAG